jgi:type I restriction enzyme M protein
MASSASDAGNKDKEIRQKLVESGHVDVMMSIGTKFFYTRSLPCTLWFFDRGKPADLLDTVLMIDARNVYTVVSARSHVFTDEQLANLSAITWLYRGENDKFVELAGALPAGSRRLAIDDARAFCSGQRPSQRSGRRAG